MSGRDAARSKQKAFRALLQISDLPERVRLLSERREGGVAPRPMDCDTAYYIARLAEELDSEGGCGGGEEGAEGGDGAAED